MARCRHAEPRRQIERADLHPPRVEVVDHQLHHVVPLGCACVRALQDEAARTDPEDRDVPVEPELEAEREIELLRRFEVLRRQKWARELEHAF